MTATVKFASPFQLSHAVGAEIFCMPQSVGHLASLGIAIAFISKLGSARTIEPIAWSELMAPASPLLLMSRKSSRRTSYCPSVPSFSFCSLSIFLETLNPFTSTPPTAVMLADSALLRKVLTSPERCFRGRESRHSLLTIATSCPGFARFSRFCFEYVFMRKSVSIPNSVAACGIAIPASLVWLCFLLLRQPTAAIPRKAINDTGVRCLNITWRMSDLPQLG